MFSLSGPCLRNSGRRDNHRRRSNGTVGRVVAYLVASPAYFRPLQAGDVLAVDEKFD
jgi:hypothetical protein